jgi:hypothetical protein
MTIAATVLTSRLAATAVFVASVAFAAGPPATQTDGFLDLKETSLVDFEKGKIVANQNLGADLWFEVTEPGVRFLTPVTGAAISSAQMQSTSHGPRNYPGCAAASFSTQRVPLASVPVGSYVCVRTRDGNISQFHLNSIAGDPKGTAWITLKLGFTTWKKPLLLQQKPPQPPQKP